MVEIPGLSLLDADKLGRTGLVRYWCVFCGCRQGVFTDDKGHRIAGIQTNLHHDPPRSRIPRKHQHLIPLFTACGFGNVMGCHGLAHHNHGSVRVYPYGDRWQAIADERGAVSINERRALSGRKPIEPGTPFNLE